MKKKWNKWLKRMSKRFRKFWHKRISPQPKASLKVLETIQNEKKFHMDSSLEFLGGIVKKMDEQNAAV